MIVPSDSITKDTLRALIATRLDIPSEEIPEDTSLVTLGMNSLEIMTIVNRLRRQAIPVTYEELVTHPTLDGWWHVITKVAKTL